MKVWLWASAAWYGFSGWALPILLRLIGRLEVEHAGRVPLEGPLVVVANHLNILDPILVCAVSPRRLRPMAKRELFEVPLIGWVPWLYGAFPVRRFSADLNRLRDLPDREGRTQIGGLGRLHGDIVEDLGLKSTLSYRERILAQRQVHVPEVPQLLSARHPHGVGG